MERIGCSWILIAVTPFEHSFPKRTGLSLGYLSKLENDLTSPTIAHLHKICEALGLTINDILAEPEEHTSVAVVHRAERKPLFQQNRGGLQFEALTRSYRPAP